MTSGGTRCRGSRSTFAVASGGGSITGASQSTNASGIATVGSWTLGTTAGTNTLTATFTGSGLTGNPVTFTATGGGSSGTTRTFVGSSISCANGGDWSCGPNWSPAGVPTASDSVIIPNTAYYPPNLSANAVAGAVVVSGFDLTLDGYTLTVTRGFATTGSGFLSMSNSTDSLIVGGDATFNGGASRLQAGVLVAHGSVLQSNGATLAFHGSGTFTTALVGGGAHNLQIVDPYSNFQNLDLSGTTGSVSLLSQLYLGGTLVDTGTVAGTVLGSGTNLAAQSADVTGRLTFDNTQVLLQGPITAFDNVTFQNYPGGFITMLLVSDTGTYTFTGLTFPASPPIGSLYLSANASGPAGLNLTIQSNLTPSFAQTYTSAGPGVTVTWQ